MKKYKLRFFIEWGGNCLWPDSTDRDTYEKYDVGPVLPEDLGVSKELCSELDALEEEYQTALNWEYPPDPSPWSDEHFSNFYTRLRCAYRKLCTELEAEFDIIDAFCKPSRVSNIARKNKEIRNHFTRIESIPQSLFLFKIQNLSTKRDGCRQEY